MVHAIDVVVCQLFPINVVWRFISLWSAHHFSFLEWDGSYHMPGDSFV